MKIRWGNWATKCGNDDNDDMRMQMKENKYFISNKTMQFDSKYRNWIDPNWANREKEKKRESRGREKWLNSFGSSIPQSLICHSVFNEFYFSKQNKNGNCSEQNQMANSSYRVWLSFHVCKIEIDQFNFLIDFD